MHLSPSAVTGLLPLLGIQLSCLLLYDVVLTSGDRFIISAPVRQRSINSAIVSSFLQLCSVLDLGHGTPLAISGRMLRLLQYDQVLLLIVRRQQKCGFNRWLGIVSCRNVKSYKLVISFLILSENWHLTKTEGCLHVIFIFTLFSRSGHCFRFVDERKVAMVILKKMKEQVCRSMLS